MALVFALIAALVLAQALPAQLSSPDHLAVSRPVARRIAAASTHKYFIDLNTEDKAEVSMTHVGPLEVATYSPSGELLERPKPFRPGPDQDFVFTVAGNARGTYRIEVAAPRRRSAKYEIYLDGLSTLIERQRAAATSVEVEGRDQQVSDGELRLLRRASELLSSASVWKRQDPRVCLPDEKKMSLYCALERAQLELFGEYLGRSVAWQEVRFAVEDVTDGQKFEHRLKDFNNAPSTQFADVKRVLTIAAHRVRVRLDVQKSMTRLQ